MTDRTWHYEDGDFGPEPVADDPDRDDSEGAADPDPLPLLPDDEVDE